VSTPHPGLFATWWTDRYTRGLPAEVRDRRREEIACDVFEQQVHTASDGRPTSITWRSVRGIPADMSWRRQEMRAMRASSPDPRFPHVRNAWAVVTQRWFAPLAVLLIAFNLLFALTIVRDDASTMPGRVVGPTFLVAFAVLMAIGLWMRWSAGRELAQRSASADLLRSPVANRTIAALIAVLVLTLVLLIVGVAGGSALVFFLAIGFLLVCALIFGGRAVMRALRASDLAAKSGLANGLIIVGTLPALAMFWMIIPPLVAFAVIGGVLGTSPRLRPAA
jgi:hypothetical protein